MNEAQYNYVDNGSLVQFSKGYFPPYDGVKIPQFTPDHWEMTKCKLFRYYSEPSERCIGGSMVSIIPVGGEGCSFYQEIPSATNLLYESTLYHATMRFHLKGNICSSNVPRMQVLVGSEDTGFEVICDVEPDLKDRRWQIVTQPFIMPHEKGHNFGVIPGTEGKAERTYGEDDVRVGLYFPSTVKPGSIQVDVDWCAVTAFPMSHYNAVPPYALEGKPNNRFFTNIDDVFQDTRLLQEENTCNSTGLITTKKYYLSLDKVLKKELGPIYTVKYNYTKNHDVSSYTVIYTEPHSYKPSVEYVVKYYYDKDGNQKSKTVTKKE